MERWCETYVVSRLQDLRVSHAKLEYGSSLVLRRDFLAGPISVT